jgi:tRNA (guanine37-N1)-methyltransferase
MVLCVKVPLKKAQQARHYIADNDLSDTAYRAKKTKTHIFFPIKKRAAIKRRFPYAEFKECTLEKSRKPTTLTKEVGKKLTKKELAVLRRAFDITGSIAILEIPEELKEKELIIADTLLKIQKNVKTILKKAGIHDTEYRTQQMKYLAGEKTKETIHKELSTNLKLDVEKVYFSPRLCTERKRIAEQVKPGESILVMFSGCAPYPCVLSKHTKAADIIGVEINPAGHRYGKENIKLNKLKNISLFKGDVRKVVPTLKRKFDRIIMPLPKSAGDFLDIALNASKKGTIIHFYAFEQTGKFKTAHNRIKKECKKQKLDCRILRTVKCGQHAPRTFRICVDFKIK